MASISAEQAVTRLAGAHADLSRVRGRLVTEWRPDSPPVTVVMADYARSLADTWSSLAPDERQKILDTVEDIMVHGDDEAKDAVATGFLESLQERATSGRFDFGDVVGFLGERTKGYCHDWDRFTGIQTPGLGSSS